MEAIEAPKRAKSVKESQDYLTTPKLSQSGWDAAFNPPTKTKELVQAQANGLPDGGLKIPREDIPDFEAYVEQGLEDERKRKQTLKDQKRELKSLAKQKLNTWKISEPIGGRMINVDPVFTADEKYAAIDVS